MFTWQSRELIRLLKEKYPDWERFDHEQFVAKETVGLRRAADQARRALLPKEIKRWLAAGTYDPLIDAIEKIGRTSPLFWTGNRTLGDLDILHHPQLQQWEFSEQFRALLYDRRPSPDRIESFAEYCSDKRLPAKWTFVTGFMFLVKPHAEVIVKPRLTRWFMRFMGQGETYTPQLSADMYERYKKNWHGLKVELTEAGHQPTDMIDLFALISVAYAVSQERTGNLTYEAQVALDVPRPLREEEAPYIIDAHGESDSDKDGDIEHAQEALTPTTEQIDPSKAQADPTERHPAYPLSALTEATGYPAEQVTMWLNSLRRKGQAIFYGPPGTGKTFLAREIGRHVVAEGDGLIDMIQFHQAYDYADFMEGIRPRTNAQGNLIWENRPGIFLNFCRQAAARSGPSLFIIDEINRANLSRVFGELMHLLEYRDQALTLASGERFQIPADLLLIGTMNTADQGVAPLDQALRRRFAFFQLPPDFDRLRHFHRHQTDLPLEPLITLLEEINAEINDPDTAIGITYFMTASLAADLPTIWQTEVTPLLAERFYRRPELLERYSWEAISRGLDT